MFRNSIGKSFCATVTVASVLGFGLLAGRAFAAEPAPLNPPQQVKVAYVPIMKFATMYVAAGRGLFKKYGLDVELNKVKSGTEAIAFLTQGSVDVGGIAIVTSLWNSWNRGLAIRIIAPGGLEPMHGSSTDLLLSKKAANAGVKTLADLKGKKVAAAGGPGSGSEYLIAKALEQAHLTIRDVNLVNVGNPDIPAALAAGSVDAGLAGPPFSTQALKSGAATVLATDLTPGLMTVAFVGSGKFIKERPQVAERFVLALTEAARLMQGNNYLAQGKPRRLSEVYGLDGSSFAGRQARGLRSEHGHSGQGSGGHRTGPPRERPHRLHQADRSEEGDRRTVRRQGDRRNRQSQELMTCFDATGAKRRSPSFRVRSSGHG